MLVNVVYICRQVGFLYTELKNKEDFPPMTPGDTGPGPVFPTLEDHRLGL